MVSSLSVVSRPFLSGEYFSLFSLTHTLPVDDDFAVRYLFLYSLDTFKIPICSLVAPMIFPSIVAQVGNFLFCPEITFIFYAKLKQPSDRAPAPLLLHVFEFYCEIDCPIAVINRG